MGNDSADDVLLLHFKLRNWVWDVNALNRPNNGNLPGWGYRKGMPDDYAFAANRWDWPIEDEWGQPEFGIFAREGTVRFAARITGVLAILDSNLKEISGCALAKDNPISLLYVGNASPIEIRRHRSSPNPQPLRITRGTLDSAAR
jgi:hypothetical protein